ncbi:hypothetical protein BJY52DRAFT_76165 [Lactarius psammicola]|nr:hypothetical protein BJY52DRAFT_76165 [Lactarius psammicola]
MCYIRIIVIFLYYFSTTHLSSHHLMLDISLKQSYTRVPGLHHDLQGRASTRSGSIVARRIARVYPGLTLDSYTHPIPQDINLQKTFV